jgi:S-adenosylmethionine hydrolase
VFFLSDYGRRDEFVGVVHAVLRRLAPGAAVVDLTHDVPPFDVRAGASALVRAFPHLGPGVVLGVVDPGVGGPRRAVAVEVAAGSGPRWLVGPDNGLLPPASDLAGGPRRVIVLDPMRSTIGPVGELVGVDVPPTHRTDPPGSENPVTFDGRDLFAPAAAALVAGIDPSALGKEADPSSLWREAEPVVQHGLSPGGQRWVRAEVTWVDRFGNVQLAARGGLVPGSVGEATLTVAADVAHARTVRRVRTFADLSPGEPGLLADGNGHLALVVREASAADHFGVSAGVLVELVW